MSLLLIRVETIQASSAVTQDGDQWGLELVSKANGEVRRAHSLAFNTQMNVEVSGLIARVEVSQQFRNEQDGWAEGIYRFPLPDGAAVDRMRVEAGDRALEGEIQEKQTARRSYQKALDSGIKASLVEQQRPNQFETRLANIGPGEDINVVISFLTRVEFHDGTFSLQIPMTFTPRWESDAPSRGESVWSAPAPPPVFPDPQFMNDPEEPGLINHRLSIAVDLQTGLSLAQLESRYHDVDIHPTLSGYHVFLSDPDTRTDRMFELSWAPDLKATPQSALLTWDGGDAVYAMLMLAPPLEREVKSQARELIFIIDTSGSMEGASLVQAKSALLEGLALLDGHDRFNLIQFNSHTEMLFESSEHVDPFTLQAATDYIDSLYANGGTNMAPALHTALAMPQHSNLLRQVVFITDGSVGNESDLLLQIAEELGDTRLFTVAIGSAPNTWFMRKAAEIGRGSYTSIAQSSDVAERIIHLWGRIRTPALQDVCVDWGMAAETYPEIIPDLYAGEPLWVLARLPLQPHDITVCGELDGGPWEQHAAPHAGDGSENIATMWARSKVDSLEESRIFGLDEILLKQEITAVALEYGLLTSYTSLVAVDRTPSRPANAGLDTRQVPSMLPSGSTGNSAVFAQTATGWKAQVLLSLITLLIATGFYLFCAARLPVMALTTLPDRRNRPHA
jgi:Ca-activated chloride channel family protein